VASKGRHTWSHPQLPLATPAADPEMIFRKGKAFEGETSTTKLGNLPSPSVETPFSSPHLPSRPISEVFRFLNLGSVPTEFSPPGMGLEGEILVTPLSHEVVPWRRPRTTEDFPIPIFTTPLVTVATSAQREASTDSSPLVFSLNPPLFPGSSFLVSPYRTLSPPSSPPPNIPMAGANPPMTRMEAIIASRYAPLVLPQPLNALLADGYLKQLPKFTGEGDITIEEHLEAF
jgi:hypothetical protein